jgi:hypothetical protein
MRLKLLTKICGGCYRVKIERYLMASKDKKSKQIEVGLRKAVADAIERHKLLGEPIAIWQDGKVVVVPAKKIRLPRKKSDERKEY